MKSELDDTEVAATVMFGAEFQGMREKKRNKLSVIGIMWLRNICEIANINKVSCKCETQT